jgi:hypothetical protein
MSEAERESLAEVLRAELSDAVWNGAIPDLGNPNTGFAQRQIAEWVVASDWLAQHDAAVLASGDARLAALEALKDEWLGWADGRSSMRIDAFRDAAEALDAVLHSDPSEATGPKYAAGHGFTPGKFSGGCRVMLARYPCNYTPEQHDPDLPPEDLDHFGYRRDRFTPVQGEEPGP